MIWFSADWHIGHTNIIKYCDRPFSTVQEMNTTILNNFTRVVQPGDTFYFLGDIGFGKQNILMALETIKTSGVALHFLEGNHDIKYRNLIKPYCTSYTFISDFVTMSVGTNIYYLSHIKYTPNVTYSYISLHGHSHGIQLEAKFGSRLVMDVGVDGINFYPIDIVDIEERCD